MIINFKIFENGGNNYGTPDALDLPNGELSYYDNDAIPFEWCPDEEKLKLGANSSNHCDIIDRCDNMQYPGRLWKDSKIITFWVFPDKNIFQKMCSSFEKEHIKILNNGWLIVINTIDGEIKIKNSDDDKYYEVDWEDELDNEIIPVEDYVGSEDAPEEDYLMHLQKPIDKKGKAKDRLSGWEPKKFKYQLPDETEVEARNRVTKYKYQENVFFSNIGTPDALDLPNGDELYDSDDDAIPFEWCPIEGQLAIGDYGSNHYQLYNRCKNREYPGRLWEESKIMAFWLYPDEKMFRIMCNALEKQKGLIILNNGWRVVINSEDGDGETVSETDKIISADEYAGSEDVPEEKYLMHLQKPIDKKGKIKDRIPGWTPKKFNYQLPDETEVEARNRVTKYKYQENMITLFENFESSVITIVIDGDENTFNVLSKNNKVYLMMQDEIYQRLDIKIPDSKELQDDEFFMAPDVRREIVDELENQNFIQKINKESIAGDKKVIAYKL
jgi:hypothetical protein